MAVKIRNSCGAIIDYSEFKFPVSATTPHQHDLSAQPVENYRMKRELFEVYTPFYLDSQAQRMLRESAQDSKSDYSQTTQRETSAQRKRGKKKRPVLSDEEEKVSGLLERVFPDLIKQATESNIFLKETTLTDFLQTHDNNKASRISALNMGCGDLFQELCAQEMEKNMNFRANDVLTLDKTFSSKNHDASSFIHTCVENSGKVGAQVVVGDHRFLIPPRSRFIMSSFSMLVSDLIEFITVPGGYDLIVMDPPWKNKSVKRRKSYQTFDESELCSLPLHSLSKAGGVVCMWVTNNERILSYVKDVIFPTWNVTWVADWYWMKVTKCGEPICDIRSSHKKPYERLIIGKRCEDTTDQVVDCSNDVLTVDNDVQKDVKGDSGGNKNEDTQYVTESSIPKEYIITSVPCSLHSKKPFLSELLSPYLPPHPECLEMFARNLMQGWTSWGNEVLRHQHTDYYETEN